MTAQNGAPTPLERSAPTGGMLARAVVGLACALMLNGVFDSLFSNRVNAVSYPLRISTDLLSGGIGVVAMCLAVVVASRLSRRTGGAGGRPSLASRAGSRAGAVAMAGALAVSVCLLFLAGAGTVPAFLGEVGGLALSAAAILLLALWARALAPWGRTRSLQALALALALDTAFDVVASYSLVDGAVMGFSILAGIASPLLLASLEAHSAPQESKAADAPGGICVAPRSKETEALWASLACIALYGFIMGRVQSIGHSFDLAGLAELVAARSVNIGALITAALLLGLVRLRRPHLVARVFIAAFLVAALYLSGIFGTAIEPAGMIMMTVARFSVFAYIWLLACDGVGEGPVFALCAGWGAFTLANTVSTKIGLLVGASGADFVAYTLAIVACLAALVVVELVPRLGTEGAGDAAGAGDGEAAPADPLLDRCRELADRGGLTARELDVLVPLAHGRSAASIAAALGMSTETARTHIRHIYQKTGIHTREELLDIVERPGVPAEPPAR